MINPFFKPSETSNRATGWGTGVFLTLGVVFLVVSWLMAPAPGIGWVEEIREEVASVPLEPVQIGPYQLAQHADSYVMWTEAYGADFDYVRYPWYLLLILFSVALSVLLAIHSTLRRFWFFCLSGLVGFAVASIRVEGIWSQLPYPWSTVFLFLIWLLPGIFFQYFDRTVRLPIRIGIYAVLIAVSWSGLSMVSTAPEPLLLISAGLVPTGLLLLCLLMLISGHEILALIAEFLPRTGSSKHLRDFLVISLIYLVNLMAGYLSQQGWFSWNYAVSPVLLLIISGLLAVRSSSESERQAPGIIGDAATARLALAALALAGFSVLGFIFATGNDAVFSHISDFSLYIHFGFGLMFVMYVIMNFSTMLAENAAIGPFLYQPQITTMTLFRISGLLAVSVFLFANVISKPILEIRGGIFNVQADYHAITGQAELADGYYTQAARYAFHNQHSNYILAAKARDLSDYRKQQLLLHDAAERRPLAEAYVNLAELLAGQERLLDAYSWLKQGLDEMPGNPRLHQALGLLEYRLGDYDSAMWHFGNSGRKSADLNVTALLAMKGLVQNADSLLERIDEDILPRANVLTLASRQRKTLQIGYSIPTDSALDLSTATLLNNYIINHRDSLSENELEHFSKLALHPKNIDFSESLNLALAFGFYSQNQLTRAFFHMERAAVFSQHKARYNHIMALWALEQQAAGPALISSRYAVEQEFQGAAVTQAVALMEAGKTDEALARWQEPDLKNHPLAPLSVKALDTKPDQAGSLSPRELYSWTRYHAAQLDSQQFRLLVNRISDSEFRARAILDRSRWLFRNERTTEAITTYRLITGLAIEDKHLFHQIRLHELRLLAWMGDASNLSLQLKNDFVLRRSENTDLHYFNAVEAMAAGDTIRAHREFEWITRNNLWHEDAVLMAAVFYRDYEQYPRQAYAVLASALHTNPQSVRLLMAYIRECYRIREGRIAQGSLQLLRELLPTSDFNKFFASLPADPEVSL